MNKIEYLVYHLRLNTIGKEDMYQERQGQISVSLWQHFSTTRVRR